MRPQDHFKLILMLEHVLKSNLSFAHTTTSTEGIDMPVSSGLLATSWGQCLRNLFDEIGSTKEPFIPAVWSDNSTWKLDVEGFRRRLQLQRKEVISGFSACVFSGNCDGSASTIRADCFKQVYLIRETTRQ